MPRPIPRIAVFGAGPAGLMAAEAAASGGARVAVHDRMAAPARKFLMAGRGGLNLTHGEDLEAFLDRYGAARPFLEPAIRAFPPAALVAWCEGLGEPTFTGSSGRVFPRSMKASPLLRAWLRRLDGLGVRLHLRSPWPGLAATPPADATVLALGGASWPRLGSDGAWPALLPGVAVTPLRPANCGFAVAWSAVFRSRFAGAPLKRIALAFAGRRVLGEAVVTAAGIEGGAVYALAAPLREAIAAHGPATLTLDLRPDLAAEAVARRLAAPRRGQSLGNFLRKALGLEGVQAGLVQEALHAGAPGDLAALVKALPLRLEAPFGLDRAISTAGGVAWSELGPDLMLRRHPGTFLAGEMLDWEAPTGGYLLQACLATGRAAGLAALDFARLG
ncbi:NAD(P)/FAD-dependent oxidoreductase [Methylocella sp.]|uniref:NAD(P)/FAD-dependent oxidoreductase n=1 Tax=Methylocella sp. TaxID=1978226 RepID=UPI003783E17F